MMKVFCLAWAVSVCLADNHLRGDKAVTPAPVQQPAEPAVPRAEPQVGTVAKEPDVPTRKENKEAAQVPQPEVGEVAEEPEVAKGAENEAPEQAEQEAGKDAAVAKEPAKQDIVKPQDSSAVGEPEAEHPLHYDPLEEEEEFEYGPGIDEQAYWEDVDAQLLLMRKALRVARMRWVWLSQRLTQRPPQQRRRLQLPQLPRLPRLPQPVQLESRRPRR